MAWATPTGKPRVFFLSTVAYLGLNKPWPRGSSLLIMLFWPTPVQPLVLQARSPRTPFLTPMGDNLAKGDGTPIFGGVHDHAVNRALDDDLRVWMTGLLVPPSRMGSASLAQETIPYRDTAYMPRHA
ncbi:hypothetical protein B0H13DRAFT_1878905 [Mycena leptocephala]|nr:hypothetical protein B0H13DRAFT_1878905 [Mycena leptocephala]